MPSPATAIAVTALVVASGGTAIAASTLVSGNQLIKKNSLSGNRLKDHSISGTQVNLSRLGKVPSAAKADHATTANTASTASTATTATTATNATSARSVDGMSLNSFSYSGTAQQTLLNDFDGLSLTASCVTGANNGLTLKAFSGVPSAEVSYSGISHGGTLPAGKATNDAVQISGTPATITSPAGTVDTGNSAIGLGFTVGQIVYSNSAGNVVSVDYRCNAAGATCQFGGTAVGTP